MRDPNDADTIPAPAPVSAWPFAPSPVNADKTQVDFDLDDFRNGIEIDLLDYDEE